MKKYMRAVRRHLNLPRDVKHRVMTDFSSSVTARKEAGESDEQIIRELGSPKEAAAVLNELMKEYAWRRSKWRWLALATAVLAGGLLAWTRLVNWLMTLVFHLSLGERESLGIIGGADGPTAIFLTVSSGFDWEAVFFLVVMIGGLAGWWHLSHLKKK